MYSKANTVGYFVLGRIPLEWRWHQIMDAELKQAFTDLQIQVRHVDERLDSFSRQFDERFETVSRHVDERFESISRHFEERLETVSHHVDERFESISRHFEERLENTETKLLTAFHNWAQTYESRARGTVTVVRQFEDRLGFVEERLNKLERAHNGESTSGGQKS
jgi:DNA anti-recombination protein RmuC